MLERIFGRHRLRRAIWNHRTFVQTSGQLIQAYPISPERTFEHRDLPFPKFSNSVDAMLHQSLFRHFPYTGNPSDSQRGEERIALPWLDDEEPVRLPPVRRNLCQKFIGGDTC